MRPPWTWTPACPGSGLKTPQEYFEAVTTAKAALCNRMHAAVGLAGLGIPAIAVGSDTGCSWWQPSACPTTMSRRRMPTILKSNWKI